MSDTVVISGAARSGTTLLFEVFRALPGYKALNEPLLRRSTQEAYGFSRRPFLEAGDPAPRQRAFFRDSLTGQLGPEVRWAFRSKGRLGKLLEHSCRRKLVVKYCRISRMLYWFEDTFDPRGMIVTIRHPCSTVSSMMRFGVWDKGIDQRRSEEEGVISLKGLPESMRERFSPIAERVSTHAEILALVWCLDNYMALTAREPHSWALCPYERLISRGPEELKRLAKAMRVEVTPEMVRLLDKPSSSARDPLGKNASAQLGKWKQNLSPEEIDSILSVVDEAGLSAFYSESLEPDYGLLNDLQNADYRW